MRRYLAEFLSDRRVIETPRWLWWLILNLFILPRRPAAKGRDYDSIWNRERERGPAQDLHPQPGGEARGWRSAAGGSKSIGRCATASRRSPSASPRCRPRAATASCSFRSIRNIAPRRRRRSPTRRSRRCRRCAGSRRCASPRRGMTIPPISRRWRARPAPRSPRSTSSPKSCSPRSTAFRAPISTRATPTIAIAPRRRGCCATRSA